MLALQLPQLVSRTHADYERIAVRLATHPPTFARLRAALGVHRSVSPLFDKAAWARNVEGGYRLMLEAAVTGRTMQVVPVATTASATMRSVSL